MVTTDTAPTTFIAPWRVVYTDLSGEEKAIGCWSSHEANTHNIQNLSNGYTSLVEYWDGKRYVAAR